MAVMLGGYLGTWPTSAVMLLLWLQCDGVKAKRAEHGAVLHLSGEKTMVRIFFQLLSL